MKPNWFIGLPVPSGTWFDERVVGVPSSVRRFHPADLHLTVAFLGSVDEVAAAEAWSIANNWPSGAVEITLGCVAPMGNPRRASALSALLVDGHDEIAAGIAACQNVFLEAAGRPPERREPKPHLTLGRIRRKARGPERSEALAWAASLDVRGARATVSELALFTWSLDRHERLFRIVESYTLGLS